MTELPLGVTFTVGNQQWPDVEDLVTTTETPGGLKEARFSLSSEGAQIRWDDRLVIYDSTWDRYPFVGRISSIHKTGLCFDFVATRSTRLRPMESTTGPMTPAHPGGLYAGRIYRASTPMVEALRDALSLCDVVFDGGINELSGLQFIADTSNMGGYTAEQIWDYVSSLIGTEGTPLLWHVRGLNQEQVVVIDFQDTSARYRTRLSEDDIDEDYDSEQIITRAVLEWGNDQVYGESLPNVGDAGRQLVHTKYINGARDIVGIGAAQGLTGSYLSRSGKFMATSTTLTMECNKDIVRVVPPVGSSDDWPLWLLESGHGIFLEDRPVALAPYNEGLKYIIGTEYVWKAGKLVCRCGIAGGGLDSRIQRTVDYNVNRLFFGPYNGPPGGNHPLADADVIPLIGPELRAGEPGEPPVTAYGITAFRAGQDALGGFPSDPTAPSVPYGKQIDPDLVADEGLEANINFDPATAGFQAAVRTTPGTYGQYRLILGDASGLVADTVNAEFYRVIPPSENPLGGAQLLFTAQSGGLKDRTLPLAFPVILKRGDYIMVKVLSPVATTAIWAAISLHAKKNFPALKTN